MDDLQQKISQMLADPESMEQIRNMASSLFADNSQNAQPPQESTADDAFFNPQMLLKVANMLKQNADNDSANLLFALKPHLSKSRQKRVDKAVKMMKLVSLIPLFKAEGILDF